MQASSFIVVLASDRCCLNLLCHAGYLVREQGRGVDMAEGGWGEASKAGLKGVDPTRLAFMSMKDIVE